MMQKLTHEEIVRRQTAHKPVARYPICGLLNNIRSLYNVGSMFRTADGANLGRLYLSGITGTPPVSGISKTALGAELEVPWSYAPTAEGVLRDLRMSGTQILMLEQTQRSVPYTDIPVRFPCCLVVGNERSGVETDVMPYADYAVEIPMLGMKNSLNVAVAFGIVAYGLVRVFQGRTAA